ncbi:MAG TPA: hypothetical protein G4N96_13780 [Chloroflexi bacterium]|nr:hypothetical protein [Chloroflexota bacterium]
MTNAKNTYLCLNCNRPETQVPLVALRYSEQDTWICTQCLPTLIHHPHQLAGKLAGAEKLEPADHDD